MFERLGAYASLTRLDRPIGALLLLWPTLWALWLASDGNPPASILMIFLLGTLLMRSAGCAINDYADREADGHVKRTSDRPLATGVITPREALIVAAVLAVMAFLLVLQTNRLTVLLAIAAVPIAAVYPFLKRYTHLPQAWLGIAFSWGIPMAYAAVSNRLPGECWLLLIGNLFWVLAYDTIYAMVDRDDDIKIGVKSTAILLGDYDRSAVFASQMVATLILLVVGIVAGLNAWYFIGLGVAVLCALYEATLYFTRERDPCFAAFRHNTWFGCAVFAGIFLSFLP